MEDQKHTTSLTFEIDNFSEKESVISSPNFLSGGCEWYVDVFPKGVCINDQSMYLYLCVGNPESYLRLGWKIRASFSFVVLNQSLKELYRLDEPCRLFCAQLLAWGRYVPLEKLKEKGFLEQNKLILKVQVKVVEVVDEGGDKILDVNGRILVPGSMLSSVISLFMKHEDISWCCSLLGVVHSWKVRVGFADVGKAKIHFITHYNPEFHGL